MWEFEASGNMICMGSIIMDISVKCKQFPRVGGKTGYTPWPYEVTPGGKGANQAIAAARSGGKVRMLGRISEDPYGQELEENLRRSGVDVGLLIKDGTEKSGVAFVWVNEAGDILLMTMEFPEELLICAAKTGWTWKQHWRSWKQKGSRIRLFLSVKKASCIKWTGKYIASPGYKSTR